MTFKITNALRVISIIALVVVFFIAYAGLPNQVLVLLDAHGNPTQYIGKNYFFYVSLALLIFTNALIYILAVMLNKSDKSLIKLIGYYLMVLVIIINIYFSVSLTFIGILNGQENFDYTAFAPIIYASQGLFVIWILAFLFSFIKLKKTV